MDQRITPTNFRDLLEKAKRIAAQRRELEQEAALSSIEESVATQQPHTVDLSNVGITKESIQTKEGINQAVETIGEVVQAAAQSHTMRQDTNLVVSKLSAQERRKLTGVAADVSLNQRQQLFIETALSGDDICLIGAAGTGKTTVTGKFINRLLDSGDLLPLDAETKWLRPTVPGVLITSFTRKAVNNIRRAIPDALKPHVLTIHKVLEFQPVFYEVFDEKTASIKKTMKFEPQRHAMNPLPSSLTLIVYEESSMIGTDLYNMLAAAMPHNPQEIFIGDIRQLPPIFGPAILGFKMSLLPVVELNEVYRQALLSPIIRLAHSVLSGDSTLFNPKVEERVTTHPHLLDAKGKPKVVIRKYVPALEKFDEHGEYGSVKIQIWQKKLPWEMALNTSVLQFIEWEKSGYYNPDEDVIMLPFNVSFGTIELNKGIQNYLGLKREAVVHEVIAREQKHYLAIGDRVLFDKEDAVIVDIRRNATYVGKSPQSAHKHLDRWGTLQKQLSEEETNKLLQEEQEFSLDAMDKFMEVGGDSDEDKVNQASHAVYIRFTYSDEEMILSQAGEVNALIGGNAITIHKMQGSEAEKVFLVLHHSHAAMVQNELLYTGITRARTNLHVICEIDTFFKGSKSHKVRGVTLQDKIEFFRGKVEFKEMQQEMELLTRQREAKKRRLEEVRQRELEREQDQDIEDIWENTEEAIEERQKLAMQAAWVGYHEKWRVAKEVLEEIEEERIAREETKEEKFTKVLNEPAAVIAGDEVRIWNPQGKEASNSAPEKSDTIEPVNKVDTTETSAAESQPTTPTTPLTTQQRLRLLRNKISTATK